MISILELERRVFELDEIRIVIRDKINTIYEGEFNFTRKAMWNMRISDYIEKRIKPIIGDTEVTVVMGNGQQPHPRQTIEYVRSSYVETRPTII